MSKEDQELNGGNRKDNYIKSSSIKFAGFCGIQLYLFGFPCLEFLNSRFVMNVQNGLNKQPTKSILKVCFFLFPFALLFSLSLLAYVSKLPLLKRKLDLLKDLILTGLNSKKFFFFLKKNSNLIGSCLMTKRILEETFQEEIGMIFPSRKTSGKQNLTSNTLSLPICTRHWKKRKN